jgi:hypothetical protein
VCVCVDVCVCVCCCVCSCCLLRVRVRHTGGQRDWLVSEVRGKGAPTVFDSLVYLLSVYAEDKGCVEVR